jgi:hypothetical protein
MEAEMARDDGTIRFEIDPGLVAEKPAISALPKHNQSEDDEKQIPSNPPTKPVRDPSFSITGWADLPKPAQQPDTSRSPARMSDNRGNQLNVGQHPARAPCRVRFTLRLPIELLNAIDERAAESDQSDSQIIREILAAALKVSLR